MTYQYTYRTTASELWQLSMYYIYGSMVGLCNLIFTGAIIALIVAYWQTALIWQRALLIAALSVFTVLQPLVIYRRARRQAARITEDTTLSAAFTSAWERNRQICPGARSVALPKSRP